MRHVGLVDKEISIRSIELKSCKILWSLSLRVCADAGDTQIKRTVSRRISKMLDSVFTLCEFVLSDNNP